MRLGERTILYFRMLEGDGVFTLFLSNLVLIATFCVPLIFCFSRVLHMARGASSDSAPSGLLVVLGLCLKENRATEDFIVRLDRALLLYRDMDDKKILLLGGVTEGNSVSEAECGRAYLLSRGVPEENICVEDQSRNTLENMRFARPAIKSTGIAVFISNRYHLARCSMLAQGMGLEHRLCAAEGEFHMSPEMLFRLAAEAYYLHWYMTGKYWSILTRNRKSLDRIR